MCEDRLWQSSKVASAYLEGVRAAIPLAGAQIDCLLRIVKAVVPGTASFLDLGCGDGVLGRMLAGIFPGAQAVYVDFSETMIQACEAKLKQQGLKGQLVSKDYGQPNWTAAVAQWGPYDLIVSGLSIHHQPDQRKRGIYSEIFSLLRPGGLFLNLEHVASLAEWGEAVFEDRFADEIFEFRQAQGDKRPRDEVKKEWHQRQDKVANILAPLDSQCQWLREIGFKDVDCFFKIFELALFGGVKP